MRLVLIHECKLLLSYYFKESQYIARRRVGFIIPVLIVAALYLPAFFLYSQQSIAADCGAFQQGTEQSNGELRSTAGTARVVMNSGYAHIVSQIPVSIVGGYFYGNIQTE